MKSIATSAGTIALLGCMAGAYAQDEKAEEAPVTPEVEVKTVKTQPVIQIRFKAKREEIGQKLGPAYGRIMGHIMKNGGKQIMMPMSRYYGVDGDTLDMAAATAVAKPVPSDGDIKSDELPAGKVASITHMGPYEKLPKTYAVLEKWIAENDHEPGEHTWEIYWTDPGAEPDPAKWRTEVVRQLKK